MPDCEALNRTVAAAAVAVRADVRSMRRCFLSPPPGPIIGYEIVATRSRTNALQPHSRSSSEAPLEWSN